MPQPPDDIAAPTLRLGHCSVEEHARSLCELRRLPFWWYLGTHRLLGNFSLPFQDGDGNWWYQVKPGLCWAADCFRPLSSALRLPFHKAYLGFQCVVGGEEAANSHLVINAILDLGVYGVNVIAAIRRAGVRAGFRRCELSVLDAGDRRTILGCLTAWNDLSTRTGWKHVLEEREFVESWRLLLGCPGESVIVGKNRDTGEVAGFLIGKIIGDTAYVDTIASRTSEMQSHINDALVYGFLINSAQIPCVVKAHCAIKSYVSQLERFKESLGFHPHPFPARTVLRPGVGAVLKRGFPDQYNRMIGNI